MVRPLAVALIAGVFLAGLLPAVETAGALVKFDFEQKYFVEFGTDVKDHSIIRVDGVYHLFYLRGNPAVDIGHAASTDLVHWEQLPPVLYVEPGTWDDFALWAPQLTRDPNNGTWVMYYTGVNHFGCQQTGIAVSVDLVAWIKLPEPVYHPDPAWALWDDSTWCHGRDPFAFEYNNLFYQLLTAKTPGDRGAIACGVSQNRYSWADRGPLYVHSNWHVLESIQCLQRNNKWYLFFTEETVNGTSYMKSDSLFNGWTPGSAVVFDFGHAAEINQFDVGTYIISRHSVHNYNDGTHQYVIRADTLRWSGEYPYVYRPWPLTGSWTNVSGNAFLFQPVFLNNPYARGVNVDIGFEGMCWLSSYERYQGPLGVGTPGAFQGDAPTGLIRSKEFTITGNSMRLLVGGGDFPDHCYVALVNASDRQVLLKETGKNTDEMDERAWDLRPYKGARAYIEVLDNSSAPGGHISCDAITESSDIVDADTLGGYNRKGRKDNQILTERGAPRVSSAILHQNTPNPFNPSTSISYELPAEGRVTIDVFDVNGRRVERLKDEVETGGPHSVTWDARTGDGRLVPSGIYFYRLRVDGRAVATKKMMLLK